MSDQEGQLIEISDDRVGVRFERRLSHPPERVWRAVTEADEPQVLRFALEQVGDGTLLVFTHELPRADAAKVAAGWQLCLDDLAATLAGAARAGFPEERWMELHEEYAEQFGVSPEPGRRALRERQAVDAGR